MFILLKSGITSATPFAMVIGFGLFADDDLNIPVSNFQVNTHEYIFIYLYGN